MVLTEICKELRNWFIKSEDDKVIGAFEISNGAITPFVDLKDNQYYRIIGSLYNDGVHRFGDSSDVLIDETFDGAIWKMYVPNDIVRLSEEISEYKTKYGEVTPYQSESFGGYSYTLATSANGNSSAWQNVFATKLNAWRKI